MSKEKEKIAIPPYVPYKTFKNFVDGLNPVPSVIDGHVLKSMGGALRSQLLSSLRYLKLLDANNKTQPELKTLAAAKSDDRKKELNKIVTNAYPFLFADSGDFSLTEGTYPQFSGKFQDQGASGDTIRRCGKFFLDAAQEAGIIVSPYIKSEPITKPKGEGSKSAHVRSSAKSKNSHDNGGTPPGDVVPQSEWQLKLKAALDLLPTNFDKEGRAHWTKSKRDSFLMVVTAIVDAYAIADTQGGD